MADRDIVFGDAVYEAWRRGLNYDLVDKDMLRYYEVLGCTPEECISREMSRISPRVEHA